MVTKDDVLKVAKLAKLSFDENELGDLANDLQNIINFADEIEKIDLNDSDFDNINGLSNRLREDIVQEPFDRELILKNANGGKNGFFHLRNHK